MPNCKNKWTTSALIGTSWCQPITGCLAKWGPLRVGVEIRSARETFVCNKAVKLWSEFEFNEIPGQTKAEPTELEEPGNRSKCVAKFSYVAREAGYNGGIVTIVSENEEERIDYPEPLSYCDDNFKPFTLT